MRRDKPEFAICTKCNGIILTGNRFIDKEGRTYCSLKCLELLGEKK
jgi:hypothetical protein